MKPIIFLITILFICPFVLVAQETIVLDGNVVMKRDLNQYKPYEVDVTKPEKTANLKRAQIGSDEVVSSSRIFASKEYNSFAQSTVYEPKDSLQSTLPSSKLKFFDKTGKMMWEKTLVGKAPGNCFLSPDGKYSIVEMSVLAIDPIDTKNSLEIYDNQGNTLFSEPSPVNFQLSNSRDVICYQKNRLDTGNPDDDNIIFCYDLKSKSLWTKRFNEDVEIVPISSNGDFILTLSGEMFSLFNRQGKEIFTKNRALFGKYIDAVSDDGNFILSIQSSATVKSFFDIYYADTMQKIRTEYFNVEETMKKTFRGYNGGCFVKNSKYIIALTSIIAPNTAMIVFHNLHGLFLGYQVYPEIKSSFFNPEITLLDNGSFEIIVDGYYLGNLILPSVQLQKYLKK